MRVIKGEKEMELKKQTDTVELINNLRKTARQLHEDTTLHTVAFLMNDAADKLTEYMRADLERG